MKTKIILSCLLLFFIFCSPIVAGQFLELKVVELGKEVPNFTLEDTTGKSHQLQDYRGNIIMIHFWSATCPYVVRYEERLQLITSDYQDQEVVVLAINSNSDEKLGQIKKVAKKRNVNYPILIDPDNKIADQFGAITTPHVYLIDREGKLVYEGAVDDQGWSEENPVNKRFVRDALDAVLAGKSVPVSETKTVGCTVKRKF